MIPILLTWLTIVSVGKTQSLDSLVDILSNSHGLSINRIASVKLDIARDHTRNGKYPEGLALLSDVIQMAKDSLVVSKAFRVKAQILFEQHRFQEVIEAIRSSNLHRPKNADFYEVWVCNNLMALIGTVTGDYEGSFKHFYESLLLCEKNSKPQELGISSLNLGFAYYKVFDYRTALKYFLRARELPLDSRGRFLVLTNLALAYAHLDSTRRSMSCLNELFSNKGALSKGDFMYAYYAYGITFQKLTLFDSARYYFDRSLNVSRELNDDRYTSENSLSLATIDLNGENKAKASVLLRNAEKIANENSYQDILLRVHEQKILLSRIEKNFKDQIITQKLYIEQKKGLYNPKLLPIVARGKASFYEREYQTAIRNHYELLEYNGLQSQNIETLGNMGALIVFLTACVILLLIISVGIRKRNAIRLERTIRERSDSCKRKVEQLSDLIGKNRNAVVEWRRVVKIVAAQLQKSDQAVVNTVSEIPRVLGKNVTRNS
jgi:tetratricopeptide (TPR) repeat protein